jgi:hypothetical protein
MKRKRARIAIAVVVLLLIGAGVFFLWPQDRTTRASWERIQVGMTEKEVEAILGGPGLTWDEYQAKELEAQEGGQALMPDEVLDEPMGGFLPDALDKTRVWRGRRGELGVQFDHGGQARHKYFKGGQIIRGADPSFFGRLRDWLGW